jgi:hypothetical protein
MSTEITLGSSDYASLREWAMSRLEELREFLAQIIPATAIGPNPFGWGTSSLERKRNELIGEVLAAQKLLFRILELLDKLPQFGPEWKHQANLDLNAMHAECRRRGERLQALTNVVGALYGEFRAKQRTYAYESQNHTLLPGKGADNGKGKVITGAAGAGVGAWVGSHMGIAMFGGAISGVLPVAALGVWAALKLRDTGVVKQFGQGFKEGWQQGSARRVGTSITTDNNHQ